MFFNNSFILASSSQSRYYILKKNNLNFKRIKPKCNEATLKNKLIKNKTSIKKISLELARLKSKSISKQKRNCLVVGSDTVIDLGGKILSKARNLKEAKKIIVNMSGKSQFVYSSISVFFNRKEVWKVTQRSEIKIRKLSNLEIDKYLSKVGENILGSVGCYQLEKLGPHIVEDIKGDFFNVMGFPLFPFLKFLKKYTIKDYND